MGTSNKNKDKVMLYEKEGKIAIITINRPEKRNALTNEVWELMYDAVIDFRTDPDLWVLILTGAGDKAFSSGADINFLRKDNPAIMTQPVERPPTLYKGIELWKPVIAAVNGWALAAGCELILACDIRIAAEHSRFGLPEIINIGTLPTGGSTQRLPRMIPWCHAADLLLTGRSIDAQEAYRIGLINEVVPLEKLMPRAREWAELLCRPAPLAVRGAKEAMIRGYGLPLDAGLRLESDIRSRLFNTEDRAEAPRAFLEKRKPDWKGK